MKYVLNYQKFLEKFEILDSDEPDVKMAKEKMNSLQEQFTEFNQKKASIDAIYKDEKLTPEQVEEKLKQVIGLEEESPDRDRNPFLIEYSNVCRLEKEVSNLQDQRTKDKLKIQEFQEELSLLDKEETKLLTKSNINDLNTKLAEKSKKIIDIEKEIQQKKTELSQKMTQVQTDINEYTKKIQDEKQK